LPLFSKPFEMPMCRFLLSPGYYSITNESMSKIHGTNEAERSLKKEALEAGIEIGKNDFLKFFPEFNQAP
jgi:hypothetical protein